MSPCNPAFDGFLQGKWLCSAERYLQLDPRLSTVPPLSDLWQGEVLKPFCDHSTISECISSHSFCMLGFEGFLGSNSIKEQDAGVRSPPWVGATAQPGFVQEHPREGQQRQGGDLLLEGLPRQNKSVLSSSSQGWGARLSSMLIAGICLLLTALPVSAKSLLFNLPDLLTAPCFEVVGSS